MGRTSTRTPTFRVTFAGKLANATLVPADAPLPPFRRPAAPTSAPAYSPPPTPPVNPADTAFGREMAADRKMIQTTLANIQAQVADFGRQQAANLEDLQNIAVELAVTIATQLLHREVTADEFPVESMIRDMAAELVNDTPATIWLNPDDLKLLERRLGGQRLLADGEPRLVADRDLKRCECRVEGGNGSLVLSDAARHVHDLRDKLLKDLADARHG